VSYEDFFLNSSAAIGEVDCLEISHSAFSQTHYLVRNYLAGVTVTHEDETEHEYTYCPMKLSLQKLREDLDFILNIQLGDVGEILNNEVQAILAAAETDPEAMAELPQVIYRTYRSDDFSVPLFGPAVLGIKRLGMTAEGSSFDAKAPSLNANGTGEVYSFARFPMLKSMI
jgi:hypothetical protein